MSGWVCKKACSLLLLAAAPAAVAAEPASGDPQVSQPSAASRWVRDEPLLRFDAVRRAIVMSPPDGILFQPQVRKNLESGLTTTLLLQVQARDGRQLLRGSASLAVRFEPWEEVFIARLETSSQRSGDQLRLGSLGELAAEWSRVEVVLAIEDGIRGRRLRARVDLEVIPFSRAEEVDAELWFRGEAGSPTVASPGEASILELIMATGIRRERLVGYRWREVVSVDAAP